MALCADTTAGTKASAASAKTQISIGRLPVASITADAARVPGRVVHANSNPQDRLPTNGRPTRRDMPIPRAVEPYDRSARAARNPKLRALVARFQAWERRNLTGLQNQLVMPCYDRIVP